MLYSLLLVLLCACRLEAHKQSCPKPAPFCVGWWAQCGGGLWDGPTCCAPGSNCEAVGPMYKLCVPHKPSKKCAPVFGRCDKSDCCDAGSSCEDFKLPSAHGKHKYCSLCQPKPEAGIPPACHLPPPNTTVIPRSYHQVLDAPGLQWLWYDGISPHLPADTKATRRNVPSTLVLTLQGAGSANPQDMDPFGSGMRVSSKHAYKAGKVCANVQAPRQTYGGTIWGMYLMSFHPTGSERSHTKWQEADFEWLGRRDRSKEVDVTAWALGLDEPDSFYWPLNKTAPDATVQTNIRYCITWDLRSPCRTEKFIKWEAALPGKQPLLVRNWTPPTPESNQLYNNPVRAVFTIWSTPSIEDWSGVYDMPADKQMQVTFSDITFAPVGEAYCPQVDEDLQPLPT